MILLQKALLNHQSCFLKCGLFFSGQIWSWSLWWSSRVSSPLALMRNTRRWWMRFSTLLLSLNPLVVVMIKECLLKISEAGAHTFLLSESFSEACLHRPVQVPSFHYYSLSLLSYQNSNVSFVHPPLYSETWISSPASALRRGYCGFKYTSVEERIRLAYRRRSSSPRASRVETPLSQFFTRSKLQHIPRSHFVSCFFFY